MRKLIVILLLSSLLLSGCTEERVINVNMEGVDNNQSNIQGFVDICDSPIPLSYDPLTKNVYIKNYIKGKSYVFNCIYTAYYAPNGKPYLYDAATNTFEINDGE